MAIMQFFCILDQLHERERESFTTLAQQRVRVTAGEGLHISQLGFAVLLSMAERMKKKEQVVEHGDRVERWKKRTGSHILILYTLYVRF